MIRKKDDPRVRYDEGYMIVNKTKGEECLLYGTIRATKEDAWGTLCGHRMGQVYATPKEMQSLGYRCVKILISIPTIDKPAANSQKITHRPKNKRISPPK